MTTNTEKIFSFIDTYAEKEDKLYLEAIIQACELWLSGESTPSLSSSVTKEEIRRGIQLAILKGMRQNAQPHHQMTPDAIGMLIGHIVTKVIAHEKEVTLLDLGAGTGNLLYTVMNSVGNDVTATAVEIDELLVRLSAVTAELLEHPVTYYVQDALRPLFVDPVDIAIADVPVGYYPDDENALNYELMPSNGHAYSHHLFIEQAMNHTKSGGYGVFIVPANLFESEQSSSLHPFLKRRAIIRAVIQLPDSLFKNSAHEKSIIILQKPKEENNVSRDVLLARVPTMSDKKAMALFLRKIDMWAAENND